MNDRSATSKEEQDRRIEEITGVVLRVLETRGAKSSGGSPAGQIFRALTRNWVLFVFSLSVISALAGWLIYDISLLRPLEEIAFQQRQDRLIQQRDLYMNRMEERHIKLANSFLNVAQLQAAKGEFQKVLALRPHSVEAHFGLMKAEIFEPIIKREYDPGIAEQRLKLLQQERPNDPHIYSFLGDVYLYIDREKAAEYYSKAIAMDPDVAHAYHGVGLIHDLEDQPDQAIEMYSKAWELSTWNQNYLNNLAYQYLRRKNYSEAIEKYRLLLSLDGGYLLAYYTISNAYRLSGNLQGARWYQEQLTKHLDNENLTKMARNAGEWYFHGDGRRVHFYEYPRKKYYAYLNLALTLFLLGDDKAADSFVVRAKALEIADISDLHGLINFDAAELETEHPNLKDALGKFRKRYLPGRVVAAPD